MESAVKISRSSLLCKSSAFRKKLHPNYEKVAKLFKKRKYAVAKESRAVSPRKTRSEKLEKDPKKVICTYRFCTFMLYNLDVNICEYQLLFFIFRDFA